MSENVQTADGLPNFERWCLQIFLKVGSVTLSDNAILKRFQNSTQDILRIVDEHDWDQLSQPVSIPRLHGLEEFSCRWSILMTLQHLARVNQAILEVMRAIRGGSVPFGVIKIADHQPDADVANEVVADFRSVNQRYWAFAKSHQPLKSIATYEHPWFGLLDGHGWHWVAMAHQNIHRRQIYKILAVMGVV